MCRVPSKKNIPKTKFDKKMIVEPLINGWLLTDCDSQHYKCDEPQHCVTSLHDIKNLNGSYFIFLYQRYFQNRSKKLILQKIFEIF